MGTGDQEAAARSYNRARRWLLVFGAELADDDLVAVEDYLSHARLPPAHMEGRITDRQRTGQLWLEAHSASADSLTSKQIEAFVSLLEVSGEEWLGSTDMSKFRQHRHSPRGQRSQRCQRPPPVGTRQTGVRDPSTKSRCECHRRAPIS
jgi:hypothetical protein